ncbi:MAG TPA: NAD(P)H-binding protein [Symbiobacteriaceae bacterium]|jgi:NADH dehydrogenase|nr:NAD(P)H-binding protein [Symbiobacteriaceae bacterium]
MTELHVVTGAFSYTGKYITRRLLEKGIRVKTLTNHPDRVSPFDQPVETAPYDFDHPERLVESLRGATTLYNTYWVRFAHGETSHETAVKNTETLFRAAKAAGVRRIVHVSIANPDPASPLPYYSGKGRLEQLLESLGLEYAILRPTVIFGDEDILINNIAWLLRRFPVFGIPGDGAYRVQPIYVEDFADLVVAAGRRRDNFIMNCVGPETCSFTDLVRLLARTVGSRARILHLPPMMALSIARCIGLFLGDVVLTRDEVAGLSVDLLAVDSQPTGTTRLTDWLRQHAATLGAVYHSELKRHYR